MKKILLSVIFCVTSTVSLISFVYTLGTTHQSKEELLSANVEALTNDETNNNKPKCSTKTIYCVPDLPCPTCGNNTGFRGTVYSCQAQGNELTCKKGKLGRYIYCNHSGCGIPEQFNTVKKIKCLKK